MKFRLAILCLTLVASVSCKKKNGTYDDSLISGEKLPLTAPDGWTHDKFNGKAVLLGPTHNGFRTNINLAIESNRGTLASYVDESMAAAKKELPNLQVLEKSEFQTSRGKTGFRCKCSNRMNNVNLRQTFYIFEAGGDKKHVFTCSALASHGDALAPAFDAIMKTYAP